MSTPCRHPSLYFCPQSGENDCASCGGFDVCCDNPQNHTDPRVDIDGVIDHCAVQWHAERVDDWSDPTEWKRGPFTLRRSNAGFGWNLVLGHRIQFRSRKATTAMWPRLLNGADENCNRAVTLVLWPLGSVDVWWEPQWRTDADGPCEACRAESRADGCCEWCGCRPCGCDILRPSRTAESA